MQRLNYEEFKNIFFDGKEIEEQPQNAQATQDAQDA